MHQNLGKLNETLILKGRKGAIKETQISKSINQTGIQSIGQDFQNIHENFCNSTEYL